MDTKLKSNVTYEQFEACARVFIALSDNLGDGWELRCYRTSVGHQETVFLVKNCTRVLENGPKTSTAEESDDGHGTQCLEDTVGMVEESDPAVLLQCTDSSASAGYTSQPLSNELVMIKAPPTLVHVEYHIVYSTSYEVPVLYLNASYSNGRQLALEDTWSLVAGQFTTNDTDKWGLLTQQEHPLLSQSFYHIHPCHTATVMGQATSLHHQGEGEGEGEERTGRGTGGRCEEDKLGGGNYLVSWLSMFGALVGLKVPLGYVQVS